MHKNVVAFSTALLLIAVGCTSSPAPTHSSPPPVAGRPNVLIILTDDQRAQGTLESMPLTRAWLENGGTLFSDAFVTTPICCPSRSALLTGMYAHNTGIHMDREDPKTLTALEPLTIERVLHEGGYTTGLFGKYFNSWPNENNPAYFDHWAVTPHVTFTGADWNVDGKVQAVDTYSTSFIQAQALSFLDGTEKSDAQPWFLYVAPMAPHMPATPEPQFAQAPVPALRMTPARKETDLTDKPPIVQARHALTPASIDRRRLPMLRSLMSVDAMDQALMLRLQSLGELNNTLVVFSSDNGFLWGEHARIGKCAPYLESVKVPLLISWPGHMTAGAVDDRLVALLDLAPTIFGAAGLTPTHPLDGIDLLDRSASRSVLLLEYWRLPAGGWPSWTALVSHRYEFVQYGADGGRFREYYDLRADPAQLVNLLRDRDPRNPDTSQIRKLLRRYSSCAGTTCPR